MKNIILIILSCLLMGCAEEAGFVIDNKTVIVQPYGWADYHILKNDSIIYRVNVGNVVWSVILCETIVVPIWLTGWQFYEPVRKVEAPKPKEVVYH